MPSLRRSLSSLSVRSSPYPSSPSSASTGRARATAPHPRRSSGATAERRVLADIEWWRVYDGQCDPDLQGQAQDDVQALENGAPPSGTVTLSGGSTPSLDPMQSVLSIAPYSPIRHGRSSSVESTPELSTTPLEIVQLDLANCPFGPYPPSLMRLGGRQAHPHPGLRSVSAPGPSRQGALELPDFADMGGDSFSLNQNVFQ